MGILSYLHLYPQRLFGDGERQSQSTSRSIILNPQAAHETQGDTSRERNTDWIPGLNSYCYWRPAESPNHSPRKLCPCLLPWANQSLLVSAVWNTPIRRPYKGPSHRHFPGRRAPCATPQAEGVILNQKIDVKNIIRPLCKPCTPTIRNALPNVSNQKQQLLLGQGCVLPRTQRRAVFLGALWVSVLGLKEAYFGVFNYNDFGMK